MSASASPKPPAYTPRSAPPPSTNSGPSTVELDADETSNASTSVIQDDSENDQNALPPPYRFYPETTSLTSMRMKRDLLCLFHDASARRETYTSDLDETGSGYYVVGPQACRYRELRLRHNHDPSLRMLIWQPVKLHPGDIGYYDPLTGHFTRLFNAFQPRRTATGILRYAQSLKYVLQGRIGGQVVEKYESLLTRLKRGFSTTRSVRQNPYENEAIVFAEDAVFRSITDRTSARMWFSLYIDEILSVYGQACNLRREDIVFVTGCLDSPRWSIVVSEPGAHGRLSLRRNHAAQSGEPWAWPHVWNQSQAGRGSVIADGSNSEATVLISGLRMHACGRMLASSI